MLSSSQSYGAYQYDTQNSWTNVTTNSTVNQNPYTVTVVANAVYQANFDPPKVGVTIDQKNSANNTVDSVDIVENGTIFTKYAAPKIKNFTNNSTQVFRGTQKIVSGEKYNYWKTSGSGSIVSDVINHHSFTIISNITPIVSQLAPVVDGTSFQVSLPEVGTTYADSIRFKDPWLIDYTDSYGMRNQGMSAPFKKVTTGGNPLGTGTSYKGVLKNQVYDPANPQNPYYSVQATSTKTINGIPSYFLNWSNNSYASVTQPSNATSPVVFTNANAVVTANYKGTHLTNTSTALSNSSQRKVVRTDDNGYLYLVYESMNRIWLERSTNGGTSWTLCNNGQPIDNGPEAKSPSLDYIRPVWNDYNNYEIFITYQQKTANGNYTIEVAHCNPALSAEKYNFYLVWQETNTAIKQAKINIANNTVSSTTTLSAGSGYTYNYSPSITVADNGNARISWVGKRWVSGGGLEKSNAEDGYWERTTVFRTSEPNSAFWTFGSEVTSTDIARATGENAYIVAWSKMDGTNQYTRSSSLGIPIKPFAKSHNNNQIPNTERWECKNYSV